MRIAGWTRLLGLVVGQGTETKGAERGDQRRTRAGLREPTGLADRTSKPRQQGPVRWHEPIWRQGSAGRQGAGRWHEPIWRQGSAGRQGAGRWRGEAGWPPVM